MSSERLNKTAVKDARLKDLLLERGTGAEVRRGRDRGMRPEAPQSPGALAGGAAGSVCRGRLARGDGLV